MNNRNFRRSMLGAGAVAALAALACAGPAGAANFNGRFDPISGIVPNMSYDGTFTVHVDDSCLTLGVYNEAFGLVGNGNPCGSMSLLSATVTLFETSDPSVTDLVTFAPPAISSLPPLTDVVIAPSGSLFNVTGLDTSLLGPQLVSFGSIYTGPLWLQFISDFRVPDPAFIYTGSCTAGDDEDADNGTSVCTPNTNNPSNPASVTITRVPEPGSLALALGALAAGWFVRRRRSAS